MKRLLWTRPLLYWEEDKEKLKDRKIDFLYYPCLSFLKYDLRLPFKEISSEKSCVILTSFFSAQVFCELWGAAPKPKIPFYVMGEKTYQYLKTQGFSSCLLESKKGSELAQHALKLLEKETKIFLPGAKLRAFDMFSFFSDKGFKCESIDLYETKEKMKTERGSILSMVQKQEILSDDSLVISFCSPSAVRGFLASFNLHERALLCSNKVLVIGDSTYESCKPFFSSIEKSSFSKSASLLDAYEKLSFET